MKIEAVARALQTLRDEGLVEEYAVGGAVGATFYLEPVATVDVDVFVTFASASPGSLVDPTPLFAKLEAIGHPMDGEYVTIDGWPVQLLSSSEPLIEEGVKTARTVHVNGQPVRVFSPEHLAAICLQTGRAKDKARLAQFLEEEALDLPAFEALVTKHGLSQAWRRFRAVYWEQT